MKMKLKQLWQSSLVWLLLFWCLLALIYHMGRLVIVGGVVVWLLVLFITAPGVFWNYASQLTFNHQKKEKRLRKAVSFKPSILQPYTSLAMIYTRQKRWPEVVAILEPAIALENNRSGPDVKVLLAIAYRESGNYQKALAILTGLIDQGNKSFISYINLAVTYLKMGRWQEALDTAEKARSFDVNSNQLVLLMGRSHFELGDFQKARDDYEWTLKHLSWPVESFYWLGRAELELGDTAAASDHLKTAVERIKDDPDLSDVTFTEAEEWLQKATAGK